MTYANLKRFVDQMKLNELYQPWVILYLTMAGGAASLEDLAANYPTKLDDATKALDIKTRLRQAIEDVLEGQHGVVTLNSNMASLNCSLSPVERISIALACLSKEHAGRRLKDAF